MCVDVCVNCTLRSTQNLKIVLFYGILRSTALVTCCVLIFLFAFLQYVSEVLA